MPFSMTCTNKGCGKTQEPYLNVKDNKVCCSACDKEIVGVSNFAKVQMKNLRQFKQKKPTSFSVKCIRCDKEGRPKIINDNVVCSGCLQVLDNLSLPFRNMLKEKLKNIDKDI